MSRINTTIKLEEIDAYIKEKHGTPRGLTLAESDVLRKWTNEIVDVIKLNWPVRTGTSRAAWSAYTKPGPGIEIIITNSVENLIGGDIFFLVLVCKLFSGTMILFHNILISFSFPESLIKIMQCCHYHS